VKRIALTAGLCVGAVSAAVAGAFVHPATVQVSGFGVPYGLIIALAGLIGLLVLAQWWAGSRIDKVFVAAAWLVPVFVLSQGRPAGDLVIAADARGLVFLYGGVALIGLAIGLPVLRNQQDAGADGSFR
jgi:FtsH-binding integral membrane protein